MILFSFLKFAGTKPQKSKVCTNARFILLIHVYIFAGIKQCFLKANKC